MPSARVEQVRKFWHQFFNEERLEAFDKLAHADYKQNGRPSDGSHLKSWARDELFPSFKVHVAIVHEIEYENKVAVYWVANLAPRSGAPGVVATHGINILEFSGDRVVNNWHIRNLK